MPAPDHQTRTARSAAVEAGETIRVYDRERRRERVAKLYLRGLTDRNQLLEKLQRDGYPCSLRTLSEDLKVLDDRWKASADRHFDEWKKIELGKLDDAETALEAIRESEPKNYADGMVKICDRRAKLLGLDKPTKIAPTTPDGDEPVPLNVPVRQLTDEQLMKIAAGRQA